MLACYDDEKQIHVCHFEWIAKVSTECDRYPMRHEMNRLDPCRFVRESSLSNPREYSYEYDS